MTDYVDKQLTVAIAVEQRANFLGKVGEYRGQLESLDYALQKQSGITTPKEAWKIAGEKTV